MSCCPGFQKLFMVLALIASAGVLGSYVVGGQAEPAAAEAKKESKMLRHVVMFQFKEASSEADVAKVVDAFRELPNKIPAIADFEYGTNNSPEGLNEGLTHCFLVTFKSEEDREAYLPHAAHLAFVEVLKPHLEKVMVLDYWAGK